MIHQLNPQQFITGDFKGFSPEKNLYKQVLVNDSWQVIQAQFTALNPSQGMDIMTAQYRGFSDHMHWTLQGVHVCPLLICYKVYENWSENRIQPMSKRDRYKKVLFQELLNCDLKMVFIFFG